MSSWQKQRATSMAVLRAASLKFFLMLAGSWTGTAGNVDSLAHLSLRCRASVAIPRRCHCCCSATPGASTLAACPAGQSTCDADFKGRGSATCAAPVSTQMASSTEDSATKPCTCGGVHVCNVNVPYHAMDATCCCHSANDLQQVCMQTKLGAWVKHGEGASNARRLGHVRHSRSMHC